MRDPSISRWLCHLVKLCTRSFLVLGVIQRRLRCFVVADSFALAKEATAERFRISTEAASAYLRPFITEILLRPTATAVGGGVALLLARIMRGHGTAIHECVKCF